MRCALIAGWFFLAFSGQHVGRKFVETCIPLLQSTCAERIVAPIIVIQVRDLPDESTCKDQRQFMRDNGFTVGDCWSSP